MALFGEAPGAPGDVPRARPARSRPTSSTARRPGTSSTSATTVRSSARWPRGAGARRVRQHRRVRRCTPRRVARRACSASTQRADARRCGAQPGPQPAQRRRSRRAHTPGWSAMRSRCSTGCVRQHRKLRHRRHRPAVVRPAPVERRAGAARVRPAHRASGPAARARRAAGAGVVQQPCRRRRVRTPPCAARPAARDTTLRRSSASTGHPVDHPVTFAQGAYLKAAVRPRPPPLASPGRAGEWYNTCGHDQPAPPGGRAGALSVTASGTTPQHEWVGRLRWRAISDGRSSRSGGDGACVAPCSARRLRRSDDDIADQPRQRRPPPPDRHDDVGRTTTRRRRPPGGRHHVRPRRRRRPRARPQPWSRDPFTLGVASGDPDATSVVLWTRLAPDPLAGGGMPDDDVDVRLGDAAATRRSPRSARRAARPRPPRTATACTRVVEPGDRRLVLPLPRRRVHEPGRGHPCGADRRTQSLRFADAPAARTTRRASTPRIATSPSSSPTSSSSSATTSTRAVPPRPVRRAVRTHGTPEITTLDDYRNRYALYKSDADLQAAHAACPWFVTWDDHEVENNYAGLIPQDPADQAIFPARRRAAYQAWWEHQPVALPPPGDERRVPDLPRRPVGRPARASPCSTAASTAATRRAATPELDTDPACAEAFEPGRTMLGDEQEEWLLEHARLHGRRVERDRQPGRVRRHHAQRRRAQLRPVGRLPGRARPDPEPPRRRAGAERGRAHRRHPRRGGRTAARRERGTGPPVGVEFVTTSVSSASTHRAPTSPSRWPPSGHRRRRAGAPRIHPAHRDGFVVAGRVPDRRRRDDRRQRGLHACHVHHRQRDQRGALRRRVTAAPMVGGST